jgi:peptidylprolyl isomerase
VKNLEQYALAALVSISLTLTACGAASSSESHRSKNSMSPVEVAQLDEPKISPHSGPAPQRLEVKDLEKGRGTAAAVADEVTIEYVGADYKTGTVLWRSRGRLGPFRFQLGGSGVIPGWERGLVGLKVGGRRELIVPSRLATGNRHRTYVVDLLGVHRQTKLPIAVGASDGPEKPGSPTVFLPSPPPSKKLIVSEIDKGTGRTVRIPGKATVKYVGVDYKSGSSFFNAWGPNLPSHIALEDRGGIWAQALAGMQVGGQREVFVPARLAYGGGPLVYAFQLTSID